MSDVNPSKTLFSLPDSLLDWEAMGDILDSIKQPKFSPKDLKISPRVFQHWKDFELMPYPIEADKWVKLNFIEFIWGSIICDLRKLGCSLPLIKKLKVTLFENISKELIDKKIEENPEVVNKILDGIGINEEARKGVNLKEMVDAFRQDYPNMNIFIAMLSRSLIYKANNIIYIMANEEIEIWLEEFQEDQELLEHLQRNILSNPHISIPLSYYIFKFIDDKSKEGFLAPFAALTEEELNVLKAIRNMEFKEVTVKPIRGKGKAKSKKYDIITVKDGELSEEQQKQITEILALKNYQSITLKKKNNSSVYFEREHRR